jgi:hypothetical protein
MKNKDNEEIENESEKVKSRYDMKQLIINQNARKRSIYNNSGVSPNYDLEFNFLNLNIDRIEDMIMLCLSPYEICERLSVSWSGISGNNEKFRMLVYLKWCEETKYLDRITNATRLSADIEMSLGKDFMIRWLNNPNLDMQHVGLVREIGLYYSRMAEFKNRGKFARRLKYEDNNERKGNITITKDAVLDYLKGLDDKEGIGTSSNESDKQSKGNEDDFIDFEEMKD